MKWLIMIAFYFLYWGICVLCTGNDKKNLMGLRSYPDAVQSLVRTHMPESAPKDKSVRHTAGQSDTLYRRVLCVGASF